MKKLVLLLVLVCSTSAIIAQQADKDIIKVGNEIQATYYYDNGLVSQKGQYTLDGKLQGKWISYDVNGNKTAVANYDNGEKVGIWYFYDGDVLKEVKYSNSKIAQVTTWKESETRVVSNFE